jgi:ribosomal protein L18
VNAKKIAVIAALVLSGLMAGTARASEEDQAIKVNFSQTVEIPNHVLPAGTYWFVIVDTNDRQTVRILNEDRSKTIAIIQTVNRERSESLSVNGGTSFTIAERAGEPAAVVAWFYPGRTTGHEFIYPKQVEKELAMAKHDTQVSGD